MAGDTSEPRSGVPPEPVLHKAWIERPYHAGLCPNFVWAHEMEGTQEFLSIASLATRADGYAGVETSIPRATHLRRLNVAMVHDLEANAAAVERLARIAFGQIERGDDDRFVPMLEIGPSGDWGAGREVDRNLSSFRRLASTQGYELKRVESLARIEQCERWTPGEEHPRTLWFVAEGLHSLRCFHTAPIPPSKLGHESDEEHQFHLQEWQRVRLLVLKDCKDPDYLWLALADQVLFDDIACRAAKSYYAPLVSPAVLGETLIPWPPEAERQRIFALFQKSVKAVDDGSIGSLAEELQRGWEGKERDFSAGSFSSVSVRDMRGVWRDMLDNARCLVAALEPLVPEPGNPPKGPKDSTSKDPSSRPPSYPPAPIAIARRQLWNENTGSRRIRAALELAQVAMELDAAILLALLHRIDPSHVSAVLRKVLVKPGPVRLTLGHKKDLVREARDALRCATKNGTTDAALAALISEACDVNLKTWKNLADYLVEIRNAKFGHGFQLPPAAEQSLSNDLVPKAEEFVNLLHYMNAHMLVFLESRTIARSGTTCVLRMLVHENPLFERNVFLRPKGTAIDGLNEQEVYLHYAEPDGFLSLWPWVLFAPGNGGSEAIWLFDGTKKNDTGVYKSALVPGDELPHEMAGRAALSLIRGTG